MTENHTDIEARLGSLESKINSIVERNQKVELDKAWETSSARKLTIVVLTYLLMSLVLYVIGVESFLINAIIPTLGYYLSTQSVPIVKKHWIERKIKL